MKCFTTDVYDDFECIADACPATCCAGWKIVIDKKTVQKMSDEEAKLGIPAGEWLIEEGDQVCARLRGDRCYMLNEDNLCNVVLKLGSQYLSVTCAQYPRILAQYGDVTEAYLNMSCPEVVRQLMDRSAVRFLLGEADSNISDYPYTQQYLFESSVRMEIINLIQKTPGVSLKTRLFISFVVLDKAICRIQRHRANYTDFRKEIEIYLQDDIQISIKKKIDNSIDENKRYRFLREIQKLLPEEVTDQRFRTMIRRVKVCFQQDEAGYLAVIQGFFDEIRRYEVFFTNYWVYRIFQEGISIPDYEKTKEKFIYIASEFCLIQMFALALYMDKKEAGREEYIYTVSAVSRMMEHNKGFRDNLTAQLNGNDIVNAAGLMLMILI